MVSSLIYLFFYHQEFAGRHPTSDLLKMLTVIHLFDQAVDKPSFCDRHYLRLKTMEEIGKLRKQLICILEALKPGVSIMENRSHTKAPFITQETLLRQIFLSGFIDRIAVKKGESDHSAYHSTATDQDLYIHPSSCLFHARPQWVVYRELVQTSKLYMKEVTEIEPTWIPVLARTFCSFSKPLNDPPPHYDASKDKLMCYVTPTYYGDRDIANSGHGWTLPVTEIEFPEGSDYYRYFAKVLLEGHVFVSFGCFVDIYISKPSSLTRSWTQSKISALVDPLAKNHIHSKKILMEKW
jgi:ATP-dependent RNA helicase DHX37/DHR1